MYFLNLNIKVNFSTIFNFDQVHIIFHKYEVKILWLNPLAQELLFFF